MAIFTRWPYIKVAALAYLCIQYYYYCCCYNGFRPSTLSTPDFMPPAAAVWTLTLSLRRRTYTITNITHTHTRIVPMYMTKLNTLNEH